MLNSIVVWSSSLVPYTLWFKATTLGQYYLLYLFNWYRWSQLTLYENNTILYTWLLTGISFACLLILTFLSYFSFLKHLNVRPGDTCSTWTRSLLKRRRVSSQGRQTARVSRRKCRRGHVLCGYVISPSSSLLSAVFVMGLFEQSVLICYRRFVEELYGQSISPYSLL